MTKHCKCLVGNFFIPKGPPLVKSGNMPKISLSFGCLRLARTLRQCLQGLLGWQQLGCGQLVWRRYAPAGGGSAGGGVAAGRYRLGFCVVAMGGLNAVGIPGRPLRAAPPVRLS